ncbi:hypothetical protein EV361DRAFT_870724 [Lentinula raphanica]|nr:hypothetical protein EV361DRAFT_870724 [Lentinula raphanica]
MNIHSLLSPTRFKATVHVVVLLILFSVACVQAVPIEAGTQATSLPAREKKSVQWGEPLTKTREFERDDPSDTESDDPSSPTETEGMIIDLQAQHGSKAVDFHYEVHFKPEKAVKAPPLSQLKTLVEDEEDPYVYESLPHPNSFEYTDFSRLSAKRFLKIAGGPLGLVKEMERIDKWFNRANCPNVQTCRIHFEIMGKRLDADPWPSFTFSIHGEWFEGWMDASGLNGVMSMPAEWGQPGFFIEVRDGNVVRSESVSVVSQMIHQLFSRLVSKLEG